MAHVVEHGPVGAVVDMRRVEVARGGVELGARLLQCCDRAFQPLTGLHSVS
jgi:hypothetical protein